MLQQADRDACFRGDVAEAHSLEAHPLDHPDGRLE
jgi:hypothetical protein